MGAATKRKVQNARRSQQAEWRHADIRPRKRYGQHFLVDPHYLDKIVDLARLQRCDTAIEVGAGLGHLTQRLAAGAGRVVALEVDTRLLPLLAEKLDSRKNVELVRMDALHWPLPAALEAYPPPRKVLGNLPYNVGTRILLRFIHHPQAIDRMVMMFQLEVAERLVAHSGSAAYGGLSLMVQLHWQVDIVMRVPSNAFRPRPRVESALVVLQPLAKPRAEIGAWQAFVRVIRAAFGQRRKTLKNALKSLDPHDRSLGPGLLEAAGIEPSRRAETLDLDEFAHLSRLAAGSMQSLEAGQEEPGGGL
jgi:16S rRNA (adenine1518-N6/adenine1519-N6)-dimethyltransferase